jgi:hypothetical protein
MMLSEFLGLLNESKYSNLENVGRKMFAVFASTYICEQTFSKRKRTNPKSGLE